LLTFCGGVSAAQPRWASPAAIATINRVNHSRREKHRLNAPLSARNFPHLLLTRPNSAVSAAAGSGRSFGWL
jgi:hypothetical protein